MEAAEDKSAFSAQAQELVTALDRALRARRIFSEGHPTETKHKTELLRQFESFFNENDELPLEIFPYELKCQDETIYRNSDERESFAFRLFKDGIRSLSFQAGLTADELNQFLPTLVDQPASDSETDIYTEFWEREFEHIQFRGADQISFADQEQAQRTNDKIQQIVSGETVENYDHSDQEDIEAYKNLRITINPRNLGKMLKSKCVLSFEEIQFIQDNIQKIEKPENQLLDFCDMILAVLMEEESPQDFFELTTFLADALETMILQGHFGLASSVITRLHSFETQSRPIFQYAPKAIADALKIIFRPQTHDTIIGSLNHVQKADLDGIEELFSLIPADRFVDTFDHLRNIADTQVQRAACKGLAKSHRGDIGLFRSFLESDDRGTIQIALYILSHIRHKDALKLVTPLLSRNDPDIQKYCLNFIKLVPEEDALPILLDLLQSPIEHIRVEVLRILAVKGNNRVGRMLAKHLGTPAFQNLRKVEKRAYFSTIGALTRNDFLPYVKKILYKRNWFGNQEIEEAYELAIHGLISVPTSEAMSVLEDACDHKNRHVQTMAIKALKSHESKQDAK